jgi:hypothetical protein
MRRPGEDKPRMDGKSQNYIKDFVKYLFLILGAVFLFYSRPIGSTRRGQGVYCKNAGHDDCSGAHIGNRITDNRYRLVDFGFRPVANMEGSIIESTGAEKQ